MSIYPTITGITRLSLQALVSKTSTFNGASVLVDTSLTPPIPVNGGTPDLSDITLVIHVASFDAGQTARIQITGGTYSGSFTPGAAVWVQHVIGGITASADFVARIPFYDLPDFQPGVTSTTAVRVDLTSISGGTLAYEAWLEY
jgi:hypothetical protein